MWDWVLAWVGLGLNGVLLVMGAVAWLRDMRTERSSGRRVAGLVDQVKQDLAGERDTEWARRHP